MHVRFFSWMLFAIASLAGINLAIHFNPDTLPYLAVFACGGIVGRIYEAYLNHLEEKKAR